MKAKASQEWWDRHSFIINPKRVILYIGNDRKEVYDQLLSLEAKIEVLTDLRLFRIVSERAEIDDELKQHRQEYEELTKQLNLTQTEI